MILKNQFMHTIINRARSATPSFFIKLRNIGLSLTAVAAAVLTAPVSLPAVIVTAAGYLATAGVVASAVSQLTMADGGTTISKTKKGGSHAGPQ
ncbi:MAG: hypothetical protein NVS3B15_18000 [Sediminibacterium sp.]